MLPEPHREIKNENIRRNSRCRLKKYEDTRSETESYVSMRMNRHTYNENSLHEKVIYPIDKEFFIGENSLSMEGKEDRAGMKGNDKEDLVHVIQTFHGPSKKKQIRVEEIFEKTGMKTISRKNLIELKSLRNNKIQNGNGICFASENSEQDFKAKEEDYYLLSSESRANSHMHMGKRSESTKNQAKHRRNSTQNIYHSPTEPLVALSRNLQKPKNFMRPYMRNTASREEIKEYNQYSKKKKKNFHYSRKGLPIGIRKFSTKMNGTSFEVKYMSSGFVRNSDLSITSHDCNEMMTNSRSMEKFRTEPIIKDISSFETEQSEAHKIEVLEKKKAPDARERELYEFFEEFPKLMSSNKKISKSSSVFDKLKGDVRDLPGIYSRFVRRSKGISNRYLGITHPISYDTTTIRYSENKYVNGDKESEDYMCSDLIEEKPVTDELLELVNKTPLKLNNEAGKKMKREKLCTEEAICQDMPSKELERNENIHKSPLFNSTHKKTKVQKLSKAKSTDKNKNDTLDTTQNIKKIFKKNHFEKFTNGNQDIKLNNCEYLNKKDIRMKQTSEILSHDPFRENMDMSPTTAITMMVLAADKVLAGKTEFFGRVLEK